jgi:hypothetical protein
VFVVVAAGVKWGYSWTWTRNTGDGITTTLVSDQVAGRVTHYDDEILLVGIKSPLYGESLNETRLMNVV